MHSRLQEEQWNRREHSPNEGFTEKIRDHVFHSFYQGNQSRNNFRHNRLHYKKSKFHHHPLIIIIFFPEYFEGELTKNALTGGYSVWIVLSMLV